MSQEISSTMSELKNDTKSQILTPEQIKQEFTEKIFSSNMFSTFTTSNTFTCYADDGFTLNGNGASILCTNNKMLFITNSGVIYSLKKENIDTDNDKHGLAKLSKVYSDNGYQYMDNVLNVYKNTQLEQFLNDSVPPQNNILTDYITPKKDYKESTYDVSTETRPSTPTPKKTFSMMSQTNYKHKRLCGKSNLTCVNFRSKKCTFAHIDDISRCKNKDCDEPDCDLYHKDDKICDNYNCPQTDCKYFHIKIIN